MLQIPGFKFAGISCGIKTGHLPDLALIRSDPPARVVSAFTQNFVKAAPVLVSQKNIRSGLCSAVIINSGNANACTGPAGMKSAQKMVTATARQLKVPVQQVLVCSTGKIGVQLPAERVTVALPKLVRSLKEEGLRRAARAILTTDDSIKVASAGGVIGGKNFRIAGFAKGAGMIEPHLATMLAFFMTDLRLEKKVAERLFRSALSWTFNRITVDGDTSTNDTALLLANGAAGNRAIRNSRDYQKVQRCLVRVMEKLALKIVEDGEGATRLIHIVIRGARNEGDASRIAYTIGNSPLVKTAFFGGDPNWGRILAAAGRSGVALDPDRMELYYDKVRVVRRGSSAGRLQERKARRVMSHRRFEVTLDLNAGRSSFGLWTSDLSLDYVKLNSCYRT